MLDSVAQVKVLLGSLFMRLNLKGKPFIVQESASDEEVESLWSEIMRVDDTLMSSNTTKKAIKEKEKLQKFLESHCRKTHYAFSVKKCGSPRCQVCKPRRLPPSVFLTLHYLPDPTPRDGHYKSFDKPFGMPTTETHRPSLQKAATKGHSMPFNPTAQTAKNTKLVVECEECGKWQVLHSKHVLKKQQLQEVRMTGTALVVEYFPTSMQTTMPLHRFLSGKT